MMVIRFYALPPAGNYLAPPDILDDDGGSWRRVHGRRGASVCSFVSKMEIDSPLVPSAPRVK
jgi:hypothetical protein